jgi:aminoglycoside 3-N-acetyltransferase
LKPVELLRERGGWVLLVGVDHEVNTSIHEAERLASRKQFVRWALTPQGVVQCGGFPGCSEGFGALKPYLAHAARMQPLGSSRVVAIPLEELIATAQARVQADPLALLCDRAYCPRCEAVRREVGLWTGAAGAGIPD